MHTRWLANQSSQRSRSIVYSNTENRGFGRIGDLTSATWIIRRPAVDPNDCFGTCWSARYGAVGGVLMADVGDAVGVGVAG